MLGGRTLRFLRLHYRATQRQQRQYEAYKANFQQPVSPFLQDEDFFKGYEDVIDVESTLPARGSLILCPTPLGNLGDMTFRSYQALKTADIIACEDTRVTGMLLQLLPKFKGGKVHDMPITEFPEVDEYSYGLADDFVSHTVNKIAELRQEKGRGLMISFNAHNQSNRTPKLVKIMQSGLTVALASDAGTPLLSDPGAELVAETVKAGIKVESLPGPVAAVLAVTASGFPCDHFFFQGYLSKTESEKAERLQKMREANTTAVIYESCHRIAKTLQLIAEVFGAQHRVYVGQELTKYYETHYYGTAEQVTGKFTNMDKVFGELTIVVSPSGVVPKPLDTDSVSIDLKHIVSLVESTVSAGEKQRRDMVISLTGASRNQVTKIVRDLKLEIKKAKEPEEDDSQLDFRPRR